MPSFAGPYLRYGNCVPGASTWTGSVLFLTTSAATNASPAAGSAPPPQVGPPPPQVAGPEPVLVLSLEQNDASEGLRPEPMLLDTILGWSFWRFDLKLPTTNVSRPVHYEVTVPGTSISQSAVFWLPASGQALHWAYFSCNGLSLDVAEDSYARKDKTYLWRDLLQVHNAFPMHALVGGGDQVYADRVWRESPSLKSWGNDEDLQSKISTQWGPAYEAEATVSYLNIYLESFTTQDVSTAYASIPCVFVWDDHDIWDGYGSYDAELQNCPVFKGLFQVARKFYLLFQQHTTQQHEQHVPEFIHCADGYHSVRYMGPQVALLAIDMRSKRTKDRILPESTYQLLRSTALDLPDSIRHLILMSGVPVVFPKIPLSETILEGLKSLFSSSICCTSIGRRIGLIDRFGQPEILDDLIDGWVANRHAKERYELIKLLQEIALAKNVRVTILSGDAHVGGVGRLYSRPKLDPAEDPLFMPQIISSAIMNAPPPTQVVKMLIRTSYAQNVDENTKEKMVKAFWPYHARTDKLLRRRNWCDVSFVAIPNTAPINPADPAYGGLRFSLRAEDPNRWVGQAEEVYDIIVPRAPLPKK